ncbi:MAG: hypothetical protein Q8P90_01940 [bacterium]|nr:hypothetical protein [bacterium]
MVDQPKNPDSDIESENRMLQGENASLKARVAELEAQLASSKGETDMMIEHARDAARNNLNQG